MEFSKSIFKLDIKNRYYERLLILCGINLSLALLISLNFFSNLQLNVESTYSLYSLFAQLSLFTSLFYAFLSFMSWFKPFRLFILYTLPLLFTLILLFIYIDTLIFGFFKNHFNSLVLNVLMTPGGWESLNITSAEFIIGFGLIGVTLLFEIVLLFWINKSSNKLLQFASKKVSIKIIALFLPLLLFVTSSLTYAFGDLYDLPSIKGAAQTVPLHQPVTIKSLYLKIFKDLPTPKVQSMSIHDSKLIYPLKPIKFNRDIEKPNILWIVVDCLRIKAFVKETAPNLVQFAEDKAQVFLNHHSGGNATRNGLFSLFYGVYSSYWDLFLSVNESPQLINRLVDLDYRFGVYSSTALTFPEFRKTIFVKLNPWIKDNFEGLRFERDLQVLKKTKELIFSKDQKPYFAFAFLDSAHSKYSYPPESKIFEPTIEDYSYSSLTDENKSIHLRNRYRNAVHFLDGEIGKLLKEMEEKGALKNTIILITGDHGEEFNEHGYVGHSGAFTKEQIQIPLIIYLPEKLPRTYTHFSSHYDVSPTFLELLGSTTAAENYSMGHSLFAQKDHPFNFSCGWDKCSLLDKNGFVLFGYPGRNQHFMEFRNSNYDIIQKSEGLTPERAVYLNTILQNMGRFSK